MKTETKTVLIVGATGYLGGHLIQAFSNAGYRVHALARDTRKLNVQKSLVPQVAQVHQGEATKPETLEGICDGVDLVVSALGITRQRDGLTYMDVDYQANMNVLAEAIKAGVPKFAYVHVLNADQMHGVAIAEAKSKFAKALDDAPIQSTVICPSGFYSDLAEILDLARKGRVYVFGDGASRMSPIDGTDLAAASVQAIEVGQSWVNVGGPQSLSHNDVAALAFEVLGQEPRISHIPVWIVRLIINVAKALGLADNVNTLDFLVTASTRDMTAPPHGHIKLGDVFAKLARQNALHAVTPPLEQKQTSFLANSYQEQQT